MSQLEDEEWPAMLTKRIAQYQSQNLDNFYKNKVTCIIVEKSRKRTSNTNNFSYDFDQQKERYSGSSINKGRNDSPIIHSRNYSHNEIDEEELNNSIRDLIEPSTILKEQLFPPEYPEPKNKKNINKNPSVIFLEESPNTCVMNDEASSSSSLVSNKRLSAYKNNTVLNQIGPAYRSGIRSSVGGLKLCEMQDAVVYYKKATSIIEEHLKEDDHILGQLIRLFERYFINKFHDKIKEAKTGRMLAAEMVKISERATSDLQQFIKIMCHTINVYYNLQSLKGGRLETGYTVFNYDNVSNFTTTMVFTENNYKIIYEIYKLENYALEKSYRKQLKQSRTLGPEDFGVDDEYCLNRKTISYIRSKTRSQTDLHAQSLKTPKSGDTLAIQEPYEDEENDGYSLETNKGIIKINKVKSPKVNEKFAENLENTDIPYEKCIQALKQLNDQKSPIHKLKTIMKVVDSITSSIEDFYNEFNAKSQQNFGGDQNFSIFCYIVGKSNVKNLLAHCKIIQNFSTCNVMNSVSGYYTATLEACVRYISSPSNGGGNV